MNISKRTADQIIREHFAKLGAKGGKRKTAVKTKTSRKNIKIAQQAARRARRKYPPCPKYKNSHRFSPDGVCYGCRYKRPK